MANELREWADIDQMWLKSYLEKNRLATEFDLDDELIGSQVSWILNADEWSRLRRAWEVQQGMDEEVQDDEAQEGLAEEQRTMAGKGWTSAEVEPVDAEEQADEVGGALEEKSAKWIGEQPVGTTELDSQRELQEHLHKLTENALSDWDAFKELFGNCLDSEDVGVWKKLADSPLALFWRAEKLIKSQKAREGEQQQAEREFESQVARAQNIIAGYFIYCRKHRITPSLEHLQDFVPVMQTGHSPAVVNEAWRREVENQR